MHYHSTFKEILAVKRAIEKFEFHLIGHKFRIEMDMSSFPKMLQFKQKMVPHQQLLRWNEWFSKYDFESFYLKGTKNVLADMLSRAPIKEIQLMACSSNPGKNYYDFQANMPKEVPHLIEKGTLHEQLNTQVFRYQSIILSKHGALNRYIAPLGIHPSCPFAHLFRIESTTIPEEVLCFIWYLCSVYTIGITFDIQWLYQYINSQQGPKDCLSTFLTWFTPLSAWSGKLRNSARAMNLSYKRLKGPGGLNPFFNPHTVYFFHRPVHVNSKSNKLHALPTLIHHNDFKSGIRPDFNSRDNTAYEEYQRHAFRLNNSQQSFHIPFNQSWAYYPIDYQMSLDEDLQYFMERMEKPVIIKSQPKPAIPKDSPPVITKDNQPKRQKSESSAPPFPPEYFQDAQLPDDEPMNIDELGHLFEVNNSIEPDVTFEEPEGIHECPDDHYGCCEEHMLEFELDH